MLRQMVKYTLLSIMMVYSVVLVAASADGSGHCLQDGAGYWCGSIQHAYYQTTLPGTKQQKHVFGNALINLIADRTGRVQVFNGFRGFSYFGRTVQAGYSYIQVHNTQRGFYSTPGVVPYTSFRQKFLVNGVDTDVTKENVRIVHQVRTRLHMKRRQLDRATVMDTVTLTNVSDQSITLTHYEIWDSAPYSLTAPLSILLPNKPWSWLNQWVSKQREEFTTHFHSQAEKIPRGVKVTLTYSGAPLTEGERSTKNYYLPAVSLTSSDSNTRIVTAQQPGVTLPSALSLMLAGKPGPIFLAQTEQKLAPHQSVVLHFCYRIDEQMAAKQGNVPVGVAQSRPEEKGVTHCPLESQQCQQLQREYNWKAKQLASWGLYRSYYGDVSVPQGSIYAYKEGYDSAPRDIEQTIPALSMTDHSLAQGELQLMMSLQEADPARGEGAGNFSYGMWGYGCAGDKHERGCVVSKYMHFGERSDLDLYFLWALNQFYAHSDKASYHRWLTSSAVSFYPYDKNHMDVPGVNGVTPLDHIKLAFYHLRDSVGTGPHGLMRIKDGDWNDDILTLNNFEGHVIDANKTAQNGESVVASEMVVSVLPDIIEMLKSNHVAENLQHDMLVYTKKMALSLKAIRVFHHKTLWFPRAFVIDQSGKGVEMGRDYIDLASQVWLLINRHAIDYGILSSKQAIALLKYIHGTLDQSNLGATFWDPSRVTPVPANSVYAMTSKESWSSFRQLLSVAYAQFDQTRSWAWKELLHTSFYWHAKTYPLVWMGTLSGPDGWDVDTGRTWDYNLVDQNNFPYANTNPNAMWNWAYDKVTHAQ